MKIPELPKITVTDNAKVITLVCYLLEYLGGLTEAQLLEIVTIDEIVSQFNLNDALSAIEKKELAAVVDGIYSINETGRQWLREFENSLAVTLRRKMLTVGKDVVRLSALKKAVKWNVSQTDKGWVFCVRFFNEMDGSSVMQVKLFSKTKEGALKAQEKFLKDPAKALSETIVNFI
jgi:DNA-binding PadR family transcriptional regulator